MRIFDKERLINAGVMERQLQERSLSLTESNQDSISYDDLSDVVYQAIQASATGYDQREIIAEMENQGYDMHDVQIAISILFRRKLILFISEQT